MPHRLIGPLLGVAMTASTPLAVAAATAVDVATPRVAMAPKPGLATPPPGWSYLAELAPYGPADIFHVFQSSGDGPRTQMHADTRRNVGILVHNADAPLTAATTLAWRWNVQRLPSKVAETTAANHDYLSIAVKFENGRDLTYMWSASLAPETGFQCPLPNWQDRETHVVVRSGEHDLGRWLDEKRKVLADYTRYIGGTPPGRITEVWLIANSIIQQGEGAASFGDITLDPGEGGEPLRVF